MFQPFDGLLLLLGTCVFGSVSSLALAISSNTVLAAIAGAFVTGVFVLLAKLIELWWNGRNNKRMQELEQKIRDLQHNLPHLP